MKRRIINIMVSVYITVLFPMMAVAAPDQYVGDTAIYSGTSQTLRPNVLIIFDNNSTMGNSANIGDPYNPGTQYPGAYSPWTVYKVTGMGNYVVHITNNLSTLENVSCVSAKTGLQTNGTWSGSSGNSLKSNGTCGNGGAGLVYLGNLLNYNAASGSGSTQTQVEIVRQALINVVGGARGRVNFGLMVFGEDKNGGKILKPVADISSDPAYLSFISVLPNTPVTGEPLLTGNGRPLAESLYDAGAYYKGVYPIIYNKGSFASPIQYECQKNFVVVITNGDTDLDNSPKLGQATALGTVGDYDGDGLEPGAYGTGTHYMDDVAKFIYQNDMSSTLNDIQRVSTYAIQVFSPDKALVRRATDNQHGRGSYHLASDANAVSNALTEVINNIVLETDSSFVAPVVPVSPENRTYSGLRVYLGFFKPISQKPWYGNLKKYGIDSSNQIVGKPEPPSYPNGRVAINSDGTFIDTSISFWSATADGGSVNEGGAGEVLINRTTPRNIYTYMGTSASLTNSSNAFTLTNAAITSATLGVATAADRDNLINFIHGLDAYDEDSDGNTAEKRGWILGDILHSKPLVVNYATYTFSSPNESNCSINKTMIFVGANDGMFHAFNDCDGSEAWAFIPPDLLRNLNYLAGPTHTYFVDSAPSVYIYDANKDGNLDYTVGDKVILIFGERRGGGINTSPTTGFYYALDVSNPASPQYLWRLSNTESPSGTNTDYSELGETWSEPKIAKVKIGSAEKIVAFLGAGYDNCNEDARFGTTQTFTGSCVVSPTSDGGAVTSAGTSSQNNPKGRGIYAVEVATLNSGVPSFTNSGRKVWGYTYGATATSTTNPQMTFSIPSEVVALDTDFNVFIDRLYVGDTGGNIWRFDVGDPSTANWTGRIIFSANPGAGGSSDAGRKMFYPVSATLDVYYDVLFFGTGDREHPLNTAVVDRLYGIKDKPGTTAVVLEDNPDDTHELVDVTADRLQLSTDSNEINSILSELDAKYGWFIKLNQNPGEKVLAPALAFRDIYYTTYSPNLTPPPDPCTPGNLGTARVYIVNGATGEAVFNFDTSNDGYATTNTRATNSSGEILLQSDRVMTMGSGIPSGVVLVINSSGSLLALVGTGGALYTPPSPPGGDTIQIYWRRIL